MRDFVLTYINGKRCELRGESPFKSLSDFLRYDLQLTGTKVVCAEGDCGSCTVLIGRPVDGKMRYRPVTSCIQYLYQLDGAHIITIEGLTPAGKLNVVQEAMVRCQGTQCGFCTPGFVVAMCSLFDEKPPGEKATDHELRRGLVGNLCRCTGYDSIVKAGLEVDPLQLKKIGELYPSADLITALTQSSDVILISADRNTLFKPTTVQEATTFRRDNPACTIVSGGTDLHVQTNKGIRELQTVLAIGEIASINTIEVKDDTLIVGAAVSLTDLESKANELIPDYGQLLQWFGSPPIKNAGTLGGNIANGSPIADSPPALYVLNAEIELTGVNGSRRVNINGFYTGYKKTVAKPDELITRVFIPLPKPSDTLKLYKVSKRKDLDISSFTAAIWMHTSMTNGVNTINDVRIAYGGVGPNIIRLAKTEAFLRGKELTEATMEEAGPIAASEVTPISDVRGSADYRLLLAENILRKFHAELNGGPPASRFSPQPVGSNGNGRNGNGEAH